MELKDVSSMHIPAQGALPAGAQGAPFAEEFPEPQRRYQMRQPGKQPYVIASVVSAFWVGSAAAFAWLWRSTANSQHLPSLLPIWTKRPANSSTAGVS